MAYTNNPSLPKMRMRAVALVYQGWSTRKVARHFGVGSSAASKWVKKDKHHGRSPIPTRSSRPKRHPKALPAELVSAIVEQRKKRNRCAEVVHRELANQGIRVSLSSVKRTLKREGLIKHRSPWKRWHAYVERPKAVLPGDLVEIDTIHFVVGEKRLYVYTLIDLASRWAYAKASSRISAERSARFVTEALQHSPFRFKMIQSDHGSEFSTWFTKQVGAVGIAHRHSRVRKATDNGHVERFNRTLQEECLDKTKRQVLAFQKAIEIYLPYYNNERMHLGINFKTPAECVQGIG